MARHDVDGEVRALPPAIVNHIVTLDTVACKLYRRARNAGPNFESAATSVRDLHTVLKHLKVEAEDPESLLNGGDSPIYIRQLRPIMEDADFTLKQLDTILEKYFDAGSDRASMSGDSERHVVVNDSDKGWTMSDSVELEKTDLIRRKLASQKLNIHMFLDTIQLHNPSKSRQLVDTTSADLDAIKDKVDVIASRICQRKNSGFGEDENRLWEQFQDALEEEGFSKDVLHRNQDILRAYIRQVDEQLTEFGGGTPSVRGLLEKYTPQTNSDILPPYPDYPVPVDLHQGDHNNSSISSEKYFPSIKMERLRLDDPLQTANLSRGGTDLSYDRTAESEGALSLGSTALISTRELMALDERNTGLPSTVDDKHSHSLLPPINENYAACSTQSRRYSSPSSSQPALLPSSDQTFALSEQYDYGYDPPPRYVPSLPPPPIGNDRNSPPIFNSNSVSAPSLSGERPGLNPPAPAPESTGKRFARLGPDGQGREIPLDAKWTRIRRSLVSPEVLAREGLRYEARPEFVAILGELKKEDIAELARKSEEARNGRRRTTANAPCASTSAGYSKKERRPEDRYHPDKYRNWDVIESRNQNGGSGYVIDPQHQHRANSIADSVSELWDSSDDELLEGLDEEHAPHARYPSSHSPPLQLYSPPYHHNSSPDDKGSKAYPFIVPSPVNENKAGAAQETTSPSATVKPKPILKNKNDDPHVRFDLEPRILDDGPGSIPRNSGRRDREKETSERDHRDRDRDKVRTRDKDREKKYRSDRYLDREGYPDRNTDRDRERNRRNNGGGSSSSSSSSSSSRHYANTSASRRSDHDGQYSRRSREERERERDRDRDRDRGARKKARSETLRAVGIGGAAASLLSVLTEAAAGL